MDIKESLTMTWDNIKKFSRKVFDVISDFYAENKKIFFLIVAILVGSLVLIILLVSLLKKPESINFDKKQDLILTEEALVPNGPELQRNYNMSRETKNSWTEEEFEEWFTVPSTKDIESLGNSNNKIVSDIVGAAP